VLQLTYLWAV